MALLPIGKTRLLPGGGQARYQLTLRPPAGAAAPDLFALFLDGKGRLDGDADLVFFNQPVHARGAARLLANPPGLLLDFTAFPADRASLAVLAANVDGRPLATLAGLVVEIGPPGGAAWVRIEPDPPALAGSVVQLARFAPGSAGIRCEAAVQQLPGDLAAVLSGFGATVSDEPPPAPAVEPVREPPLTAAAPRRSLCREDQPPPEVRFHIRWNAEALARLRREARTAQKLPPVLGLGCLFEQRDGMIGAVQGLGAWPGSLTEPPHLAWTGTDAGEAVTLSGARLRELRRLLFYVYRSGAPGAVTPLLAEAAFGVDPPGVVPVALEAALPAGRVALLGRIERVGRDYWLYRQAQTFETLAALSQSYQFDLL
ncbi:MAG: hypothetical protein EA420_06565 [Candidatus Competibacteraceae bacterium]|nr:MAG: hypothetical protein EA420_06565 [Candidatus Competibacteraceae bacterium]